MNQELFLIFINMYVLKAIINASMSVPSGKIKIFEKKKNPLCAHRYIYISYKLTGHITHPITFPVKL